MSKEKIKNIIGAIGIGCLSAKTAIWGMGKITEITNDVTEENTVGYNEISPFYNVTVHKNNFVILHVSNDWKNDIYTLKEKLNKCNQKGISVGIVLDTKADTLSQMYEDIDFIQSIIKEFKIDFPVYCNLDYIMENPKLNNSQRKELINAFLDKISRSNIYVGIYGKDTNLTDCNTYIHKITDYDCYLVQDKEQITYPGTYNIKMNLNGEIRASQDLSQIIISTNLNDSSKIITSGKYQVKFEDTYHSLALKFGLSESDLKKYNDNQQLTVGSIIKIPNYYQTIEKNKEVSYNYSIAVGIDISDYQEHIDWDRVEQTSDYVIVEVARNKENYEVNKGEYLKTAPTQIKNVISRNIDLGLYFCITKDMKVSVYEERLQEYLTRLDKELKENNVTLNKKEVPVFLDFEIYYENNSYYKLMESFEKICKNNGYEKIGIYGNQSTLKSISQNMKRETNKEIKDTTWFVWQSGGPQYSSEESKNIDDVKISELKDLKSESNAHYTVDIQQVTNVCTDTGARNTANHCDVSFLYNSELFDCSNDLELENLVESTIEIDLNNYKGVPVNTILAALDASLTAAIVVSCVIILKDKLVIKLRNRSKDIAKKILK